MDKCVLRGHRIRAFRLVVTTLVGVALASGIASGHVRYVTTAKEAGEGLTFLVAALTTPFNVIALGSGATIVALSAVAYLRLRPFPQDVSVFRETMRGYSDLLPWLLRLGFGLPLVGAGFAGYYFNPIVDPVGIASLARLLQIGMGFALLFGLATRTVAAVGLGIFLLSIPAEPLLLYSLEWIPGFLAIGILGGGRPSADQTFGRIATAEGTVYGRLDPFNSLSKRVTRATDPLRKYLPVIIRVGTGLAFIFVGVSEKLLAPEWGLNVVQRYGLTDLLPVPAELWVLGAGLSELALGLFLLVGLFTRASALVALFVFTLTLFGIPDDPVLAHIGLFSLASALLITGAGPWALDNLIGAAKSARAVPFSDTDTEPTDPADDRDGDRRVPTDD